ncbi:MAG: C39 family peptidase [Anaerolineales bacterium]|nr:C39 family peptidase [Anaerolineales bacterium]
MRKLRLLILPLLLLIGLTIWLLPTLLKTIPSRYLVRLPEPLQQLGLPDDQVPILPTVSSPVNADALLGTGVVQAASLPAVVTEPATPTAVPVAGQVEVVATETAVPTQPPTATPWPIPTAARLNGIEHQFQEWNNCGPATIAMTLSYFRFHVTQSDTATYLKPNPEDRNVSPTEMAHYVNEQTPLQAISRANGTADMLKLFIANNIPVIIELGIEPPGEYRWLGWYGHYLLVVAYDDAQQQFWVYDSWFGTSDTPMENANRDGRELSYETLARDWPHFNRNYIPVYQPEQAELAAAIIGDNMDDATMWQNNLRVAQTEAARDPNNAFFWFNLGTVYNALGQYDEAATAFDQARAIGLPWRMLWYQFGPYEAYYQVGRYDDVVLLADVTMKDRPYFEESFYYKGLALQAQGDAAGATALFNEAIRFNPYFEPAALALNSNQ